MISPRPTESLVYALREARAGMLKSGLRFLLNTLYADSSSYVRSRATPFQPYVETGFPCGDDQWISGRRHQLGRHGLAVR